MSVVLPLPGHPVAAETVNPTFLIIYSKPKVGKTELVAQLENCLLLGLEKGSKFVSALKLEATNVAEIGAIGEAIKKAGYPYQRVAVDTATALEEIVIPYAEKIYAETSQGKNWFERTADGKILYANGQPVAGKGKLAYGTIIDLPDGNGYRWLREAFFNIIDYIKTWAPEIIILGHVKDVILEKSSGNVSSIDLDLTGKIKRMIASRADAIGYMYRHKNGYQNVLSFKTNDEVACGSRARHLSNQEIIISERDPQTGALTTHWDRIYLPAVKTASPEVTPPPAAE